MQDQNQLSLLLSHKQQLALELLNDPLIVDLLYGGGAGGAKTLTICIWMLLELRQYPGIRIGLGRKELTKLKTTTVHSLLYEAHPLLGIKLNEFKYSEQKGLIEYVNGSSILLVDLNTLPGDPEFDRLGSLNLTHVVIEEGGEVRKKACDIFRSRKNRYLNDRYGIVGKSITTCNPSQNFLKAEYYKPYEKLGGGEYQKWEYGEVEVAVGAQMQTAYRAFIQSLPADNPFISRNYIEVLKKLPAPERKRLLEGNWNFEDNERILFKNQLMERVLVPRRPWPPGVPVERFIGVDVADAGNDDTILSLVENKMLVLQKKIVVNKAEAIGDQIGMKVVQFAQQNGIMQPEAYRIAIDAVGVGASTRDYFRRIGWAVKEFIAGAASLDSMYKNLRGQAIYGLYLGFEQGQFSIAEDLETLELLLEQLLAHEYYTEERMVLIKAKKDIKEILGRSPDNAESAYIAFWAATGNNDPKDDQSRVGF